MDGDQMEEIQVAKSYVAHATASQYAYTDIPLQLAKDEAAILLSVDMTINLANNVCEVYAGILKRKRPALLSGTYWTPFQGDSDVIYYQDAVRVAVNVGESSIRRRFTFPYPIRLIRTPQLFVIGTINSSAHVFMTTYYLKVKLSDKVLAEMMVKQHD